MIKTRKKDVTHIARTIVLASSIACSGVKFLGI